MNPSHANSRNVANSFALVTTSASPAMKFIPPVPGTLPLTSTAKSKWRKLAASVDPMPWYTVASAAFWKRKKLPREPQQQPGGEQSREVEARLGARAAHMKRGVVDEQQHRDHRDRGARPATAPGP